MDFWLIRDGEKAGPFADYDIRSKIEAGELEPDDPVWHEGLDGWRPLQEIVSFQSAFERPPAVPPPLPTYALPPSVGQGRLPMSRRFWARGFDLQLYASIWWVGLWLAGQDLEGVITNAWLMVSMYLPWFLFEAVMIHCWGTTPGKALLGIRVENEDGSSLDLTQSLKRAMRVYFSGVGMGVGWICQICMGVSWLIGRNMGFTLWDRTGGHRLVYRPLGEWRILACVFLLLGFVLVQGYIQLPLVLASDGVPPEVKQWYEQAGLVRPAAK